MRHADDWPFCHSRENKITAVVWTGGHRLTATKKNAEAAVRAWKTWKKRHGWSTHKLDTGFVARMGEVKEWCGVHVYDFNTRERIN